MNDTPPQACRVVLCLGLHCNADGIATAHFERLKSLLGYPNPFKHPPRLKWEVAGCLHHCAEGPNLVIYPDGEWYHSLDAATLEEVITDKIEPLLP